jgi:hypothetical protein
MTERVDLSGAAFTSRAVSFMNLMRTPAFRKNFAADPAGVAMREFQLKLPARAISSSNRLMATLLQDKAFNKWSQEFQAQMEAKYPRLTDAKSVPEVARAARAVSAGIQKEFAEGVAAHLPADMVKKLRPQREWEGQIAAEDDIAIVLLVFIAILVVVVAPAARDALISRNTVRLLINQLEALKSSVNG